MIQYLFNPPGAPADSPKFKPAPEAPQTCGPPDEDCQRDPKGDLYEAIEPARPLPGAGNSVKFQRKATLFVIIAVGCSFSNFQEKKKVRLSGKTVDN